MRSKRFNVSVIFVLCLAMFSVTAIAQSKPGVHTLKNTDVALSFFGTWSQGPNGAGGTVLPADAAGGMFELRHISSPLLGFEGTYSINRANEVISGGDGPSSREPQSVHANAHELTADWMPSLKLANVRGFGVLGMGLRLDVPNVGQNLTKTSTTPLYVYGAGLDWGLLPHIGLRLQYRGLLYKTPDVSGMFNSANKFMHTSQPMAGVYFRF